MNYRARTDVKTVLLPPEAVGRGELILVNRQAPLREEPEECSLVPVRSDSEIRLQQQPVKMLDALLQRLGCAGEIVPVSGYRPRREQEQLFLDSLRKNGVEFTRRYVAAVNCSEHQTGLAIDLGENRTEIDFIRPAFPDTGCCGSFRRLAARYGFIRRYPAGKEQITGISEEPWHFRYVGYPHSLLMEHDGLTLEEYLLRLADYPQDGRHWRGRIEGQGFELYHVPLAEGPTAVRLPDGLAHQLSGDNLRGFVVTCWSAAL